jgi:hypothetical protein
MKKLLSLALTLIIMLTLCTTAFAATQLPIEPLWDNTQRIDTYFTFNGTSSQACARIIGKPGTTRIEATLKVYELINSQWVYITENTQSVNSDALAISTPFSAQSGVYYKSVLVVHVTNSAGVVESLQRATTGTP